MTSDIKTVNLMLAIPMRFLGDEKRAIRNKLNNLVSQYVPEVDGVLIKWSDLNILNDNGIILDEQPYVFWKVTFTAQVFRPVEGTLVQGKVHQILKHYFLAKAMNSFTVTVSIPEAHMDHKIVQNLMVGQDVYFKIKGSSEGVYRGELSDECVELTAGLKEEQRIRNEANVYDYANDFEY